MKIMIIRHGDPDYSIDSLTEKGWREAELLSERLIQENICMLQASQCSSRGYIRILKNNVGDLYQECIWRKA